MVAPVTDRASGPVSQATTPAASPGVFHLPHGAVGDRVGEGRGDLLDGALAERVGDLPGHGAAVLAGGEQHHRCEEVVVINA